MAKYKFDARVGVSAPNWTARVIAQIGQVAVIRHYSPSANRDGDAFQAVCGASGCGWKSEYYSNRTVEGRSLTMARAEQHNSYKHTEEVVK